MNLEHIVQYASIFSAFVALLGLIIQYISFKNQIKKVNTEIDTLKEIVQLNQQVNAATPQYNNCTFNNSPLNANQIQNEYGKGIEND